MIIYEAVTSDYAFEALKANRPILVSYFYRQCLNPNILNLVKDKGLNLFIDSGAFSAENSGAKIILKDYINYLHKTMPYISYYAGLDDISDFKKTMINQRIMENEGLNPLITFHYGEPIELLNEYLKMYDFICLGGVVGKPRSIKIKWLDSLFSKVIKNYPNKKIHMFGVHDFNILLRYPFFSADASSNIKKAAFGGSAFGLSKAPNKSINYLKHLKLEKPTHRYFSLAQEKNHIEKYITDVWRKRGIIW